MESLHEFMYDKRLKLKPISVIRLNDSYILAIYPGRKSDADIIIKYRQKLKNGKWSNIRTPKHIHWTVDLLIKSYSNRELTSKFIDELMKVWEKIQPIKSKEERDKLSLEQLLEYDQETIEKFKELSKYGEYNIKFLILLAQLLMLQEKTNYPHGKIFQTLLKKLKQGEDIFTILATATLRKLGK